LRVRSNCWFSAQRRSNCVGRRRRFIRFSFSFTFHRHNF
jgi:hypothetical protein